MGLDSGSLHHPGIQAVVGGMERTSVLQIGPHVQQHDRPKNKIPENTVSFQPIFQSSYITYFHR